MRARKTRLAEACAVIGLILLTAAAGFGEIPNKINYQGRLVDVTTGAPLTGTHEMTFRIYDSAVDGILLWSESMPVTADSGGVISVILGGINTIDISFDDACWLEVEVDTETLEPRREIASVPYAFHASDADNLGGLGSSGYVVEGEAGSVTSYMIADGEITDDDISDDASIDRAKIGGIAWTADSDGAGSGLDADMVDGLDADAFADSGHVHDDRYWPREELQTPGTLNAVGNPVDWTKLKGVPGDFSDGIDDIGGVGDGHSLDAADGSPVDAVYVNNQGNVGIGTTSPALGKLQVSTSSGSGIYAASTSGTGVLGWSSSGTGVTGISTTGRAADFVGDVYVSSRLGVGTDSPEMSLDVEGDISADSLYLIRGKRVLIAPETYQTTALGIGAATVHLGIENTFVGYGAGHDNTSSGNTFVGCRAGYSATWQGGDNTFVGAMAGENMDDSDNTFVGYMTGGSADGPGNTCLGSHAGETSSGAGNVFLGAFTAHSHQSGSHNVFLGYWAGADNQTGAGNVFLGYRAGYYEMGSDKLYISNGSDTSNTIIYGDFSTGMIGLGTLNPERRLHIRGNNPRILVDAYSSNPEINFRNTGDTISQVWAIYKKWDTDDLRFYQDGDKVTIEGSTGNVGIGTPDPTSKLHVVGDIYCAGKITSESGCDPPYVLYDRESRRAIIDRVAREVPREKMDGAVLFWNGDTNRFEVYLPSAGEFRDLTGNLLAEVSPTGNVR
jgi:hypothetical protein